MKYLLDTHILIWILTDNLKLDPIVKTVLIDSSNEFFFSIESVREIIVKTKTGKLMLPIPIDHLLLEIQSQYGVRLLTVKPKHLKQLYILETPATHKDPFDHLLIAQAIAEKLILVSADRNFPYYQEQGLQLLINVT